MAKRSARGSGAMVLRPGRASDPVVEEAMGEIRRIWNSGLRDTVVRLGQYLIQTFYGGVEAARSLQPTKEASLRELMARADELPVSAHALRSAVRVALVVRELPRATSTALSASHHEQLSTVRDREVRLQLAQEAVRRDLTVQQLGARVRQEQPPHAGGRRRKHPLDRGMASVIRALAAQEIADGLSHAGMRDLTRAEAHALDIKARRARELLEQIQDALSRHLRK